MSLRSRRAALKAAFTKSLFAATGENQCEMKRLWGVDSQVLCEIGLHELPEPISRSNGEVLRIFWSGVFAFVSASVNAIKTGVRAIKNAKAISQVNYDSEFLNWLNQGEANNVVYKGVSDGGNNVYTGITKQKLSVRLCQHNRVGKNFIRLDTIYTDLTRNQARSIETYLIINDGASNMNKILSISRNSKFFSQAMSWASNLIGRG